MIDAAAIFAGKILIVDDQQPNVQLLELMLRRAGYTCVSSTRDSTEVCALHLEHRYDLILLDLQMPVMDGFEVMECLKKIEVGNYVPVLVITAQPSQKLRALRAGARDFISKPFESSEVLTRIHNMLEVRLLYEEVTMHGKLLEGQVLERTAELRRSEEMFRELAANIPEALWIRDTERQIVQYVNPAWLRLSGLNTVPGDPIESALPTIHPDDQQWVAHDRRRLAGVHGSHEYRLVRPDRSERWVHTRTFPIANPSGKTPWVVEIIEDVTSRREAQRQLLHLARHDALTDLPNRTLLYEALSDALICAKEDESAVSVLLLDIDNFKAVNDTLGHIAGDDLLREFASRLALSVRPGDTVGRLGGDEFAIVVPTPATCQGAVEVAHRIRSALQEPLVLDGQKVFVTASIGIANFPRDTSDLETLIRCADAAMYEAKAAGRDTFRSYTAEMNARATAKIDIENALRLALERSEFVLYFQPKMEIDSGEWSSVEALLRWNRPGFGVVPPSLFVPVLEEMGLIASVGLWVIDTACRQICEWSQAGLGHICMAVNVSSSQIRDKQFVSQVADTIRVHGVNPGSLEFEITESTLMSHSEPTDTALRNLKSLGVTISIDDFGTGYSNLAYLKRFRVDALKIDIAFIRDVTTNIDDASIAVAIINMAHSLRLKVIAEGVETREQLDFLRVHGCDEVQGYLLSKPLPPAEITARLHSPPGTRIKKPVVQEDAKLRAVHG